MQLSLSQRPTLFLVHSLFLKKPERSMSLVMIMVPSLLVYAVAEWKLRQALQATQQTVPDQKGKTTVTASR